MEVVGVSGTIRVWVPGVPIPEGSVRAIPVGRHARVIHDRGAELDRWRQSIGLNVRRAAVSAGWDLPLDEPVMVDVEFHLPRPKRPRWEDAATKPDLDKLQRAVGDGLCPRGGGGVLREDSRIVRWGATKRYAPEEPGAWLVITRQEVEP